MYNMEGCKNIPLCVFMPRADHLREINDDRFSRLSTNKDVKLIEVAVNETGMSKSNDEIHQLRI